VLDIGRPTRAIADHFVIGSNEGKTAGWMRNATCVTGYCEVQHGCDALDRYFSYATNKGIFSTAVDDCAGLHPSLSRAAAMTVKPRWAVSSSFNSAGSDE
jgi:hypothetical protein